MTYPPGEVPGIHFCKRYVEQARAFCDKYREIWAMEQKHEGCIYTDDMVREKLATAQRVARELETMIPSYCGSCRFCVDESFKRGECPEGWSDQMVCPDCRRRRRDPSA